MRAAIKRSRKKRTLTMQALQRPTPDVHLVLLLRSGGKCFYCAVPLTLQTLTTDHVHPVKLGGETVLTNVVASCLPCNRAKGHRSLDQYRQVCGVTQFPGEQPERRRA